MQSATGRATPSDRRRFGLERAQTFAGIGGAPTSGTHAVNFTKESFLQTFKDSLLRKLQADSESA
jgi:hypothetical protein